ncbi:MAG: S8 family serine peptidase [Saprospiraceae bacterium]|nr:S8 family serine peptidase [Saprospiraceae bacterium]MDZ4702656.1 S8 family serine peptidase [Saprospiraceae bacterium]
MKKLLGFSICAAALALAWTTAVSGDWKAKVDPGVLAEAESGAVVECLILLDRQADVSGARHLKTKAEKGAYVWQTLQAVARQTQAPVKQVLEGAGISYQSFCMVNAIYARVDAAVLQRLAGLDAVRQIQPNPWVKMEAPFAERGNEITLREGIEWGIERINADDVWAMGYTGQDIVIGGADTGYDWDHPAIINKYRGWNGATADHNYNWHDAIHSISPLHNDSMPTPELNPCGLNTLEPCDDGFHGTHTMGTMVGDDGLGNQIGVAPGARWIACRNMERGWGSPATYIEAFEWFLAPTNLENQNPDPSKAPHVINNSWGCPPVEGCNEMNFATMNAVVDNLKAAGIVVVVSAGNSGSNCESVNNPAAMFQNSFSIGASRPSGDTIAGFSSRGPVTVDGSGRMKPNVVAPGVSVRSCVPDTNYASFSGTSMAGPHVAGLVALLLSANPALIGDVETVETLIEQTAVPMRTNQMCGEISGLDVPNHTYGFGRVDALAAVEQALMLVNTDEPGLEEKWVSVSPNPFDQEVLVRFKELKGKVVFELYNASGQRILRNELELQGDAEEKRIRTGNLPSGVYLYKVISGKRTFGGKILKS